MEQQPTRQHFVERLTQLAAEMELVPPNLNGSSGLEDAARITQCCADLLAIHDSKQHLHTIALHCQRYLSSEKPVLPFVGDPCVYYTQPPNAPSATP